MKLLILLLFCSYLIPPIVTRHDKSEDDYLAKPSEYPQVIPLKLRDLSGFVEMEGTLVASNWILTAAHGLNSAEPNQSITIDNHTYQLIEIVIHPGFEGFENDLALVKLDKPVGAVSPIPLYRDTDELGKEITITGRGGSGTGKSGPITYDGKLRVATNIIDSISSHWVKFRFDEPTDPHATELEGISGPGDSGGPAFIQVNGKLHLAGISSNQLNSAIDIEEGHYGVIEYYTRVSSYAQWIDQVLQGTYRKKETALSTTDWGFPESEIGMKADLFMDAMVSKDISDQFMQNVFYKSFRESFDLKGFMTQISETLTNPVIGEIRRARPHVLIFTVLSDDQKFLVQLDADKRDDYLIGGLIFKKLSE